MMSEDIFQEVLIKSNELVNITMVGVYIQLYNYNSLGVLKEKSYGNINIYNEIVSFHAILRQSNLFSEKQSCDIVKNVYGGIL